LVHDRLPHDVRKVLELGSGKGYNLRALAERLRHVQFFGIDLVDSHIRYSTNALEELQNVNVQEGDFNNLPFSDESFDAIFAIESLCHSLDVPVTLSEAYRVASPDAKLIVIDAWRTSKSDSAAEPVRKAIQLTEKSMSVGHVHVKSAWIDIAAAQGWKLEEMTDLTHEIMPTLDRFERGASHALKFGFVWGLVSRLFLPRFLGNVVAGYLMSQSVREGYHTYELLEFKRNSPSG
jgi:sterol 24-C-methyltransferase